MAALFSSSQDHALRFLKKYLLGGSAVFAAISILLFFTSDIVVRLVSGKWSPEIALLVKIMAVLPLSVFVDNIYGTQILLVSGHEKQFMRSILTAGLCSVGLLFILVPAFSCRGAAISFVISELLLLSLYTFYCRKYGFRLINRNLF
jgi:PST family polysaccharide transporter